ncbi:MAG: DUF3868 domain-containing protein [Alistipes sp.]|jgi:outer membrane protein OmpA-like peptidoglycan-associated protein|nr:DUF3868 domain-containing protein [Alistipes sp.]
MKNIFVLAAAFALATTATYAQAPADGIKASNITMTTSGNEVSLTMSLAIERDAVTPLQSISVIPTLSDGAGNTAAFPHVLINGRNAAQTYARRLKLVGPETGMGTPFRVMDFDRRSQGGTVDYSASVVLEPWMVGTPSVAGGATAMVMPAEMAGGVALSLDFVLSEPAGERQTYSLPVSGVSVGSNGGGLSYAENLAAVPATTTGATQARTISAAQVPAGVTVVTAAPQPSSGVILQPAVAAVGTVAAAGAQVTQVPVGTPTAATGDTRMVLVQPDGQTPQYQTAQYQAGAQASQYQTYQQPAAGTSQYFSAGESYVPSRQTYESAPSLPYDLAAQQPVQSYQREYAPSLPYDLASRPPVQSSESYGGYQSAGAGSRVQTYLSTADATLVTQGSQPQVHYAQPQAQYYDSARPLFEPQTQMQPQPRAGVRTLRGSAHLDFDSYGGLRPGYGRNTQELATITSSFNGIAGSRIVGLTVTGYASPEGNFESNASMSQYHAAALARYLQEQYGIPDSMVRVYGAGEDWVGVSSMIASSSLPYVDQILKVVDGYQSPDVKESLMRRMMRGQIWQRMEREIFPGLRRVEYILEYEAAQ